MKLVLDDRQESIVTEALHNLLGVKQEALKAVSEHYHKQNEIQPFTERDFGIDTIKHLLYVLNTLTGKE